MRRAILHIGTEKTGSTAIQAGLAGMRDALAAQGVAYARSPGHRNHQALALYAAGPGAGGEGLALRDRLRRGAGDAPEDWLPRAIAEEVAALPPTIHTLVFSNEHCHSRVRTEEGARRLQALLAPHFQDVHVVVYLRRQDELAVSRHSTRIKTGGTRRAILPRAGERADGYFDHAALLARWGAAFGVAALRPRLFIREEFPGGDVLQDFLLACGLAPGPGGPAPRRHNPALSATALEVLRRVNLVLPRETGARAPRMLMRLLARHAPGPAPLPSRAEAMAFAARFAAGNEAVRRTFFPDRATLFPLDFEAYAEAATEVPRAAAQALVETVLAEMAAMRPRRRLRFPHHAAEMEALRQVGAQLRAERTRTAPRGWRRHAGGGT
ncbi:hypothetical protein, partial [Falsiroseomonas oryzae]|uniref:hypothetical protein n=1 Tax=Falsiroseomonas oryzae TaxID=2766473 RepID=UPI0022EAE5CD